LWERRYLLHKPTWISRAGLGKGCGDTRRETTSPSPAPAAHPLLFGEKKRNFFYFRVTVPQGKVVYECKKGKIAQMCKSERTRERREDRLIDIKNSVVFL